MKNKKQPIGRERLLEYQFNMFDEAIKIEPHKISLFEAPTGFGKSVIVTTVAEKLAQDYRGVKKIIIATPTNQLALELLSLYKGDSRFTFDPSLKIDVVFGKENYLDINNIINEVYEYVDKEEFSAYIDKIESNEDYLFEKLFENIHIEDPNKEIVKGLLKCREAKEHIGTFDDMDISITNYAFLLSNVFHVKDFDISKYIVIGDEMHQLLDIAENLLTNSFSLYRYRNLTSALERSFNDDVNLKLTKEAKNIIEKQKDGLQNILNKYSIGSKAGDVYSIHPASKEQNVLTDLKAFYFEKNKKKTNKDGGTEETYLAQLDRNLKKITKETNNKKISLAYKLFKAEQKELQGVLNTPESISVMLSPSKGYPTLNSSKGDVRNWLLSFFWDKVYAFIGVSATINTVSKSDAGGKDKLSFVRIGVNRGTFSTWQEKVDTIANFVEKYKRFPNEEDTEYVRLSLFLEKQKEGFTQGWLEPRKKESLIKAFGVGFFSGLQEAHFNGRKEEKVEHIKYGVKTFNPVFKKEQAKSYLPNCDLIKPALADEENFNQWIEALSQIIAQHHENKNSLVLCGSYHEAEMFSKRVRELVGDSINIITAHRNISSTASVEQFKREGGILFGIRNFGTGINLPRQQLEKLFIAKLPFPIFMTKKWIDIKALDKRNGTSLWQAQYVNEMILVFRQWIGRLIRSSEDFGELYIMDSRICNNRYKARLVEWIEKMSIIQKEELSFDAEECLQDKSHVVSIVDIITSMKCSDSVKKYFLENVEYIEAAREFPIPDISNDNYDSRFRRECRNARKLVSLT